MFNAILPDSNPELLGKNFIHQVLQNIGVLRISAADLFDSAPNEKIMYYLEEIGVLAIRATLGEGGEDVMLGANGYPVAGSNLVRNLIPYPFEGQLYYSVEDQLAYTYVGGSWVASSGAASLHAPQAVVIETSQELKAGLEYLAVGNLTLTLPSTNLRDGHVITVTTTGTSLIQGGDIFYLDTVYPNATLEPSQRYSLIYFDGIWYSDITFMRRIYVSDTEPTGAPEGSIWIDTSEV